MCIAKCPKCGYVPPISEEAKQALVECSQDKSGMIQKLTGMGGVPSIIINGKELVENKHPYQYFV